MLKIGEFSKLSHLTVKALRFYEKEGLLIPENVDEWTGYRSYDTWQLEEAAAIKSYRQLGLSIDEIKAIFNGADKKVILTSKAEVLKTQKEDIDARLSIINHILEDEEMKYQVTIKEIPSAIVYYAEVKVGKYSDMMTLIPELGAECLELNPGMKCANPPYEFCEYLDEEHKEKDITIRHNEAVESIGKESDRIKFKEIPAVKVLSIFHKGPYDEIGEAYAYIMKYAEENGYKVNGLSRECYIDGIWNKESVAYQQAIGVLYAVAYTLKMSYKTDYKIEGFFEYVVPPLEGFWWQDGVDGVDYSNKDTFNWISVIRLPDFISEKDFNWAVETATKKKKLDCSSAEFLSVEEGLCVQIMHLGAFDDEPATVEIMDAYLEQNGYVNDMTDERLHHEIYISDARKVAPEKLKTVIRHPIKKL